MKPGFRIRTTVAVVGVAVALRRSGNNNRVDIRKRIKDGGVFAFFVKHTKAGR